MSGTARGNVKVTGRRESVFIHPKGFIFLPLVDIALLSCNHR
jgi:hypothetical protein